MATTIADLLDALNDEVGAAFVATSASRAADADEALGVLGQTLQRLTNDGLSRHGGTERERWVGEAAAQATAHSTRAAISPGRLTQLASAADDAVALLRGSLDYAQRWALATATVDTVARLIPHAEHGSISDTRRRALIVVDSAVLVVQRTAALEPPSAGDSAPLDWAFPSPPPLLGLSRAGAISEAIAGLEYVTRIAADRLAIADYSAICIGLQSLSASASALHPESVLVAETARSAAGGWAAARAILKPFNDGSRSHLVTPPAAVGHALNLHATLTRVSASGQAEESSPQLESSTATALRVALQRGPTVAEHLQVTIAQWISSGRALAYARDLPLRESRVAEHLAGYRTRGLVRADGYDLAAAESALYDARVLTVELAANVAAVAPGPSKVPRLSAENIREQADLVTDRARTAAEHAMRTVSLYAGPPRVGGGPRR